MLQNNVTHITPLAPNINLKWHVRVSRKENLSIIKRQLLSWKIICYFTLETWYLPTYTTKNWQGIERIIRKVKINNSHEIHILKKSNLTNNLLWILMEFLLRCRDSRDFGSRTWRILQGLAVRKKRL